MKVWTLLLKMDDEYSVTVHRTEAAAKAECANQCRASWTASELGEAPTDDQEAIEAWFDWIAAAGGSEWANIEETELADG